MITNPAWFALLPVILLASPSSVSSKERIVPAVGEPVQVAPVNMDLDTGKVASGALLFSHILSSKNNSLSCTSCYMLLSGEGREKPGHVGFREFGQVSFHPGISDNKLDPVKIDRDKS